MMKPRLQEHYEATVRAKLADQFGFANRHQIPNLEKIVINVGVGEASREPKLLDSVVEAVTAISGQKPIVSRARKAISNFGLREGMPVGVSVTLRGAHMFEFLDRFINIAVPRVRDFRGLSPDSFDGRGNYTVGIKEQVIFPEVDYDKIQKIHGLDVTFVTSTDKDEEAMALLREMGMPFRGVEPVVV
ncbi:MAG: 50S ribosomal protein L5 [Gemmatimonadetes bacterium]|nr:50S ribosomal protein L5 [Gemmatimonadota bacterium]NIO30333.1 50S ribosomal protein L5 [Gemmatimonadota bacterium]